MQEPFINVAWRRAFGGLRVNRGAYRFRSHEEADQWLWRMMATLPDKAVRDRQPGELQRYTVIRVADETVVDLMRADPVRVAVLAVANESRHPP